jgi:hypothetical protein
MVLIIYSISFHAKEISCVGVFLEFSLFTVIFPINFRQSGPYCYFVINWDCILYFQNSIIFVLYIIHSNMCYAEICIIQKNVTLEVLTD